MELSGGFATEKDAVKSPGAIARRWILEIQMAKKREKDFRDTGQKIYERYRGTNRKKNSFNVLWANTEVLRPAVFSNAPKPDVRRRFRSSDALGKAVSEVLERGLSFSVDAYDFAEVVKLDVLDMLLPGRGVSRVRYIPSFRQVGVAPAPDGTHDESGEESTHEAFEGDEEEVEYEQVLCEHVDWQDFLHGPGKIWDEVRWVGFRHRFTKDDATEKFGGDLAGKLKYDEVKDDALEKQENKDLQQIFKTAEMWEVWDKDSRKVFFVQETFREQVLYPKPDARKPESTQGEPPLKFKGFFPCARPLMAVEDSSSLIPTALYEQYKEQAEELDRVSTRINKLVNQMKVRGIYDSVLSELADLLKGDDGDLVPSENTAKLYALNGDLNKAVWMLPIDMLARVLKELYLSRDQAKAAIYEITGISDIVRANTKASETLGAQELKANFANLRLSRLQKEVQRYVRDVIRLMAEVMGEQFAVATLAQMTGLQFPDQQMKIQAQAQAQQLSAQQQEIPEQLQAVLMVPSWDEIMQVLKSDFAREYRVDVETDSTVADTLANDMQALRDVLTGLVEFWQGVGPAVLSGAIDMQAVKAISLQITRRAKLGLEVEDALENGMKQPKPPAPETEPQEDPAVAQAKSQAELGKAQAAIQQAQIDGKNAEAKAAADARRLAMEDERAAKQHAYDMEFLAASHTARMAELEAKKNQPKPTVQ